MRKTKWLACTDPRPMLEFLQGKVSDRKLRLFAAACGRRSVNWQTGSGTDYTVSLQYLDAWADGQIPTHDLERVRREVDIAGTTTLIYWDILTPDWSPARVAESSTWEVRMSAWSNRDLSHLTPDERELLASMSGIIPDLTIDECLFAELEEVSAQLASVHDLFGNPFRPLSLDRSWQTATATRLAEGIYAARAFDRLPILADALEDAGCTDAEVLSHCRSNQEHVRGCWVVDLLLGKE